MKGIKDMLPTLTSIEEVMEFCAKLKEVEITEVDGWVKVYSKDRHVAYVNTQVYAQMRAQGGTPEIRE